MESIGPTAVAAVPTAEEAAAAEAAAAAAGVSPTSQVDGASSRNKHSQPRAPAPSKPSAMTPSVLGERVGSLSGGGPGQVESSKAPKGRGSKREEKEKEKEGKEERGGDDGVGGVKEAGNNGHAASSQIRDSAPTVDAPVVQVAFATGLALPRVENELTAGDRSLVAQCKLDAGDARYRIGNELGAGDANCGVQDNLVDEKSSRRVDETCPTLNTSVKQNASHDKARKVQGGGDDERREDDGVEAKNGDGDGYRRNSCTSTGAGTDGDHQVVEGRRGGIDDDVAHRSKTATRAVRLVPITAVETVSSMVQPRSLFGHGDSGSGNRLTLEGRREWSEAGEDDDDYGDGGGDYDGDDGQRGKKANRVGMRLCEEEVNGGGVQGGARRGDDGARGKRGGRITVKLDGERPWQQGDGIKGIRVEDGVDESREGRKKKKKKKKKEGRKGDLDMIPSSKKGD